MPFTAPDREQLGSREQTILAMLAQGKANTEVAAVLDILVRTAGTRRKNIKRKLSLCGPVEACVPQPLPGRMTRQVVVPVA